MDMETLERVARLLEPRVYVRSPSRVFLLDRGAADFRLLPGCVAASIPAPEPGPEWLASIADRQVADIMAGRR